MIPFNTNTPEYAIQVFWDWFAKNEAWIAAGVSVNTNQDGATVIRTIDQKLRPVFKGYFGGLEFLLGANGDVKEFYFYHRNQPQLLQSGAKLGALMPATLKKQWHFYLDEY